MSRNLWPLLKVQMLSIWRSTVEKMTGTKSRWGLLVLPLVLLGLVPMIVTLSLVWLGLYMAFASLGQGHLLLTMALTAGQLVCLVFGILYLISVFYFSQDLKLLVPLPLRPGEIVMSKFAGVLIGEYLTMAPVILPALAIYGALADVGLLFIPFALVIYLLLPVVPLVISALFSILLMRVTNLRRNRDFLRVIGAVIGIGLAIAFQMVSRIQPGMQGQQGLERLISQQQPLIQSVSKYMVTSIWATDALRAGAPALGLPSFLLFCGAAGAALFLLLVVAEKMFFGGLLGGEESASSGKQLTREQLARGTERVRPPLMALLLREIRLMNRTPSFLIAGVLPPLLVPFFITLSLTGSDGPLSGSHDLSRFADLPLIPVALLAATLFLDNLSAIPSSAISREGRWFWISRSLPVPPRLQVQAKLLHSLLFSLLNLAVIVGVMFWLGLATPFNLGVVIPGGLLAGVVTGYSGLLVDVIRPNLGWTDPQQAMKGNLNGLFAMLVNLVLAVLTVGVGLLLYWLSPGALIPGLLLLLAVEGALLGMAVGALADRRYLEYQ